MDTIEQIKGFLADQDIDVAYQKLSTNHLWVSEKNGGD